MKENRQSVPRMALDYVPAGTQEEEQARWDSGKFPLPEGVGRNVVYRDILRIAWPSLVELTLTQIASMVDMMMVGNIGAAAEGAEQGAEGAMAVAAVGLTTQPVFLLFTLVMALNVGARALVARSKGAGNRERGRCISNCDLKYVFKGPYLFRFSFDSIPFPISPDMENTSPVASSLFPVPSRVFCDPNF